MSSSGTGKWILAPHPRNNFLLNEGAVKLYCLPQAGMGAWVYASWSQHLAPTIQVLPIELPGHNTRMSEPRITDLCQLSSQIVDALSSSLQSEPYALFGHSMGAWIAWEVLQEITRRGLPLPMRLFASGNRAPCFRGPEHDVDCTVMHTLTPEEFWQAFERRYGLNPVLQDPQVKEFTYPLLNDDFKMVELYQPSTADATTRVPVTAVGATLDNRYSPDQIHAWSRHAAGDFCEVWLEGLEHNFINKAPLQLMKTIISQLATPATQVSNSTN